MEYCGTLMAVCGEKVSWFECRSWAWPLNPQARRAWKCCSQYCLSEGNLYRKIQTRSYTDGSWREKEKESSPPWLEGWVKPTQGFIGNEWRGKGVPRGQEDFFFFTKTTTLSLPKKLSWKHTNGYKFLAYPGKPSGVGFREILHIIFVWSVDTHCNTLFAFISWTFLFLRSAGCFCGCRLHTWTGLGWFI